MSDLQQRLRGDVVEAVQASLTKSFTPEELEELARRVYGSPAEPESARAELASLASVVEAGVNAALDRKLPSRPILAVTVRPEAKDRASAIRLARRPRPPFMAAGIMVAVLWCGFVWASLVSARAGDESWLTFAIAVALPSLFGLEMTLGIWLSSYLRYRQLEEESRTVEFAFSEDGFLLRWADGSVFIQRHKVRRWRENPRVFLLLGGRTTTPLAIPKRDMDPETIARLRALLIAWMGRPF